MVMLITMATLNKLFDNLILNQGNHKKQEEEFKLLSQIVELYMSFTLAATCIGSAKIDLAYPQFDRACSLNNYGD